MMEKVITTYKSLSQIPALSGARIFSPNQISTVWAQRNLEKGKLIKFSRTIFMENYETRTETLPIDITNELLVSISKTKALKAVVTEYDTKHFLEVWKNNRLLRAVDLAALDIHGPIYADVEFGALEFSPDENKILYVAEKKIPKSEPFYKRKQSDELSTSKQEEDNSKSAPKGQVHLFEQDWGEQLVGKNKSVLVQYDIEKDTVRILDGIPENVCVAQPKYSLDGNYVVGVAYLTEPRKLGLIYCTNRISTIFQLDFNGSYVQLPVDNRSVKAPIFVPDGESIVWLQRTAGGPHMACMALVKTTFPINEKSIVETVVDIVPSKIKIANNRSFHGIYCTSFPKRPWASGNRLILNTPQKYTINSYVINIDSGLITELEWDGGSQLVLDVDASNDVFATLRRNILVPDELIVGELNADNTVKWYNINNNKNDTDIADFKDFTYKYYDFVSPDSKVSDFNGIFVGPAAANETTVPLVVWPHGGPHSAFANYFFLEAATFLSLGFAILLINYRGSIGSGDDSVHYLPGKIGLADVNDCIQAVDTVLSDNASLNPLKMALCGGSHGGFLVTHLSGQYPDKFKVVVARNPVIDVASMSIISDIPDWCYVEAGESYTQKGEVDNDILLKMRRASPIVHAHKVKAPTLLQVGSKDLRVPPHQSNEYYCRLKANGIKVRMNLYDDNHPLGNVANEMDNVINTILWIKEHLEC